jgi:hypothetical protein
MKVLRLLCPALILVACNANSPNADHSQAVATEPASAPAPPALLKSEEGARARRETAVTAQAVMDRKVIRTAELRIELESVDQARATVDSLTGALNGFVANSSALAGDNDRPEVSLTLRIPTERFAEAVGVLRSMGRVRVDRANADDVTRAYQDLEIRLAVKRDLVTRLRALLTNRTAKLSDILEAERELARAVAEVEQMEGERRYLDNQVAMSTIQVTFFHVPVTGPGGALDPVRDAFRNGVRVFVQSVATVIGLAVFLLPWIVVGAGGWLGWRALKRRASLSNT